MNYYDAIKEQYPNAEFDLVKDSDGLRIENWKDAKPEPELDSFAERARELEEINRQLPPIDEQLDAIMKQLQHMQVEPIPELRDVLERRLRQKPTA